MLVNARPHPARLAREVRLIEVARRLDKIEDLDCPLLRDMARAMFDGDDLALFEEAWKRARYIRAVRLGADGQAAWRLIQGARL